VKIYFVTKNKYKIDELCGYLEHFKVREHLSFDLRTVERAVQEILHRDINVIVRRKALEAYEDLGVPCVVEHGLTEQQAMKIDPPDNGKGGGKLDGRLWREFPISGFQLRLATASRPKDAENGSERPRAVYAG